MSRSSVLPQVAGLSCNRNGITLSRLASPLSPPPLNAFFFGQIQTARAPFSFEYITDRRSIDRKTSRKSGERCDRSRRGHEALGSAPKGTFEGRQRHGQRAPSGRSLDARKRKTHEVGGLSADTAKVHGDARREPGPTEEADGSPPRPKRRRAATCAGRRDALWRRGWQEHLQRLRAEAQARLVRVQEQERQRREAEEEGTRQGEGAGRKEAEGQGREAQARQEEVGCRGARGGQDRPCRGGALPQRVSVASSVCVTRCAT